MLGLIAALILALGVDTGYGDANGGSSAHGIPEEYSGHGGLYSGHTITVETTVLEENEPEEPEPEPLP